MGNQQESLVTGLNWLAGAWESEGWFSLTKTMRTKERPLYILNCGITNTDIQFMQAVAQILKVSGLAFHMSLRANRGFGRKNLYVIYVMGFRRVQRFLDAIFPYLRSKHDRAQILRDFIMYRKAQLHMKIPYGEYEESCFQKIRTLNGHCN